nr:scaffolding protein [uncultured Mediterranean phage uvMED]
MSEELQETAEVEEQSQVQADMQEQPEESFTDRPDWLPEKFKSPEELAKSYSELERGFYQRKDDMREQVIDEINQEAMKDAPASPADYDVNFAAPEGLEYTVDENDPLLGWFKGKAHEYGLSQDEFDGLINEYAQADVQRGPDWNTEAEALGEYAEDRLTRVDGWARTSLTEEAYNVFANIPASSNMVQLFEELMELNGQPQFNMVSETEFQEVISLDDLRSMQNDPKYWKEKDPSFIAKVRAGFDHYSKRNR